MNFPVWQLGFPGGLLIAIYAAGALFGLISVREEGH